MKQKLVFILLGIAIVAGISLTVFMATNIQRYQSEDEPVSTNQPNQTTNQNGDQSVNDSSQTPIDQPDSEPAKKPTAENISDFYQRPSQEHKRDISERKAIQYESEARTYFREFKFMEGANYLQQVISDTPQDGNAQKLYELLFASSLLANIPSNEEESASQLVDMQGIKNIMSNIKDPELLFLGVLKLDPLVRAEVILNKDSLNPVYEGIPHILKMDEEEGDFLEEIRILYPDIQTLHRILFEIEGNQLFAYIMEYPDGKLVFYSIRNLPDRITPYKTISEWEKIFEKIRK